jgi:hypothetical protein
MNTYNREHRAHYSPVIYHFIIPVWSKKEAQLLQNCTMPAPDAHS